MTRIPRDCFENELVPIFSKIGEWREGMEVHDNCNHSTRETDSFDKHLHADKATTTLFTYAHLT